jgi:hypothetical protein
MWMAAWEMRGKTLSASAVALCFRALSGYELSDIARALDAHLLDPDTGQFPPKPADIVRFLRGGAGDQGQAAFDLSYRAACKIGPYQSVTFDDPIIHCVVADMGGWQQFCNWDIGEAEEKKPFMQAEFIRRYKIYAAHPPKKFLRALTGIFDHQNRLNGHTKAIGPPLLIGNPEAAERVYLGGSDSVALPTRRAEKILEAPAKALTDAR